MIGAAVCSIVLGDVREADGTQARRQALHVPVARRSRALAGDNTQRELFRLGEVGELERTGQLDRIVAALSSYTTKHWIASDELEGAGAPSYGAVAAVASYFDRVGLRTHFAALGEGRRHRRLADTVFVMVANRLLDPASKRHTILEWLSQVALPDGVSAPLLNQCYRALDVIAEQKEGDRGGPLPTARRPVEPQPPPRPLRLDLNVFRDEPWALRGFLLPCLRLQP